MRGDTWYTHKDQKRGGKHVAAYYHSGITVATQHATESDRAREINEREERERERKREREKERKRERERRGVGLWVGSVDLHTVRMNSSKNHWPVRLCRDRLGLRNGGGG